METIGTLVFRDETGINCYQTWWTVGIEGGKVFHLTNLDGNGQVWREFGDYEVGPNGKLRFSLRKPKAKGGMSRLLACLLSSLGYSVYVPGGFPSRLPAGFKAVKPVAYRRGGQKRLTAWDSIAAVMRGERPRDKNRNREREKVAKIDLTAEMARRSGRG